MTYKNPRLKHVKEIKNICLEINSVLSANGFTSRITDQCKLLLETKKVKRVEKCDINKKIAEATKQVYEDLKSYAIAETEDYYYVKIKKMNTTLPSPQPEIETFCLGDCFVANKQ